MAEEATKTPLDDSKDRLREAKDQRKIAKDRLSEAKAALVEVRRASREIIATAKNTLWHARETLRTKRKDRKHLAGRRRTLHRQRRWNKAARAKLDARIEKKQHAATKIKARIKDEKERRKRLNREGQGAVDTAPPTENQDRLLKWRLGWTRWTAEQLGKGTRWLGKFRKRIEDELKDVKNRLRNKKREEKDATEDVKKKRKELDTLTDARKKEEKQEKDHIRKARENVREKRRAVRMAASRVNSEALKFPWKGVADNIVAFGRWAGFAGVAGCFYASAVSLGAIFQFFYFRSNGVNIFSYAESVDFLAPGYGLVAFFILTAVSGSLIPLALYHLVKLIATHPLCAERVVGILPFFAKRITKSSIFVLFCSLFPLPAAAWLGYIWPSSQDCVSIVTDPPFQYQPEYVRIGSTSKYLFLRKEAGGCLVSSTDKTPAQNDDDGGWGLIYATEMWRGTVWAWLQTIDTWPGAVWDWLKSIITWPGTVRDWLLSIWAGDEGNPDPILVVPLSKITCISEIGGNGEGLCKSNVVEKIVYPEREPASFEESVDQYIAKDMGCPPEAPKIERSDFVPFVPLKGDVIDESSGQKPESKWEQEIQEFVQQKNDEARKWIVYGLASRDGISDHNNTLSRQRAETVKKMMCDASKTSSRIENCQKKVEVRSLGENHSVTGPDSRSAVIAACVPRTNGESPSTIPYGSVESAGPPKSGTSVPAEEG